MSRRSTPFSQRLWAKIAVAGEGECWLWTAGTNGNGYGLIRTGPASTPRILAHRAVYQEHDELLPGEVVRHSCDNPPCCNPAHLLKGTKKDNAHDMVERGRHARAGGKQRRLPTVVGAPTRSGYVNPAAVLTEEQVVRIRELRATTPLTMQQLADKFGVSRSTIHYVATGKTWRIGR